MVKIFKNVDNTEFDKLLAQWQVTLAIVLTAGGALLSAGIAFLVTGATEINHSVDLQGDPQNRMLDAGIKFIKSGMSMFVSGLLLVAVSGLVIIKVIQITPTPKTKIESKQNENNTQDVQRSDHSDLNKIVQYEEEIKHLKALVEIENLKVELANIKIRIMNMNNE